MCIEEICTIMMTVIKIALFSLIVSCVASDCCSEYLEEIPSSIRTWGICSDTEIMYVHTKDIVN